MDEDRVPLISAFIATRSDLDGACVKLAYIDNLRTMLDESRVLNLLMLRTGLVRSGSAHGRNQGLH